MGSKFKFKRFILVVTVITIELSNLLLINPLFTFRFRFPHYMKSFLHYLVLAYKLYRTITLHAINWSTSGLISLIV